MFKNYLPSYWNSAKLPRSRGQRLEHILQVVGGCHKGGITHPNDASEDILEKELTDKEVYMP